MNSSKKIMLSSLAALLFSSAVPAHADPVAAATWAQSALSCGKYAFGTALFASFVRYNSRIPTNDPSKCNFERLKSSFKGTLDEKNSTIICPILGYTMACKEGKKELESIVVGIYNNNNEIIPFTKIEITNKTDCTTLKKSCEALVIEEAPAYATTNPTITPEFWTKPELTCKVQIFALAQAQRNAPCAYVAIDPQFVDLNKKKSITTEKELGALYTTQTVSKKAIANEILGVIDDGLIGHAYQSGSPRLDPETNKLIASASTAPKGIYGKAMGYWKPVLGASFVMGAIWAAQHNGSVIQALTSKELGTAVIAPILKAAIDKCFPAIAIPNACSEAVTEQLKPAKA